MEFSKKKAAATEVVTAILKPYDCDKSIRRASLIINRSTLLFKVSLLVSLK